jgi:hypothetical protein
MKIEDLGDLNVDHPEIVDIWKNETLPILYDKYLYTKDEFLIQIKKFMNRCEILGIDISDLVIFDSVKTVEDVDMFLDDLVLIFSKFSLALYQQEFTEQRKQLQEDKLMSTLGYSLSMYDANRGLRTHLLAALLEITKGPTSHFFPLILECVNGPISLVKYNFVIKLLMLKEKNI